MGYEVIWFELQPCLLARTSQLMFFIYSLLKSFTTTVQTCMMRSKELWEEERCIMFCFHPSCSFVAVSWVAHADSHCLCLIIFIRVSFSSEKCVTCASSSLFAVSFEVRIILADCPCRASFTRFCASRMWCVACCLMLLDKS